MVDGKVLCVFCEDGVPNPAAPKRTFEPPKAEHPMKIRKAEEGERACACGNRLRSDNKTGICTPCRHKPKGKDGRQEKRKYTRREPLPAQPKPNGHLTLTLSASAIDHMIAQLPPDAKAAMLQNYLESAF
jgi:hypothetical protein